jgi:2-methylisocitrate lyase-like PEP mutase family enzyme
VSTSLNDQATLLRELHQPGTPLLLPNVWDAGSAGVVAEAGFPALATASASIAAMLGYPDHQGAPADEMLAAAGRVIRAVEVPVTVDAEAGYGLSAAELVDRLIAIGAAGCNLEDTDHAAGGLTDTAEQARYVADVRRAAKDAGVDLVINARVDVFVGAKEQGADVIDEALDRGRRYLEAGADCVYPILLDDEAGLARHVAEAGVPVNALLRPGSPSLPRLTALGVARVSTGGALAQHTFDALRRAAVALRAGGDPYVA